MTLDKLPGIRSDLVRLDGDWEEWDFPTPCKGILQHIHVFGDASREGMSAAVYTVIHQPSGSCKGLVAAKARLAKKSLTIPRLELVSAYMAANITQNLIQAIEGLPIKNVTGWLDSNVALHWIKGHGKYKRRLLPTESKISDRRITSPGDTSALTANLQILGTAEVWQMKSMTCASEDLAA